MKKVLLSAFGLFLGLGAFAQSSGLGFGLKAGVNFPKYNISGNSSDVTMNPTTNFHITGYLDAPIVGNFLYVQPGLSLQGKGSKGSGLFSGGVVENQLDKISQNTMWLEIPVNLVAKVPAGSGNFFVGAGPYAAFGLSGQNKFDGKEVGDFKFGNDKSLKGTDFGVNVLAGFQLGSGLMFHGGYGMGLSDIAPNNSSVKINNRVWSVGVGFAL